MSQPTINKSQSENPTLKQWMEILWLDTLPYFCCTFFCKQCTLIPKLSNTKMYKAVENAHLRSAQQWLHNFVVLDGGIKRQHEICHKRVYHLLGCFVLLVDDLQQATLFHRSFKSERDATDSAFPSNLITLRWWAYGTKGHCQRENIKIAKKKKKSLFSPLKAEHFRQTVLLRHLSEIFFFNPRFWR